MLQYVQSFKNEERDYMLCIKTWKNTTLYNLVHGLEFVFITIHIQRVGKVFGGSCYIAQHVQYIRCTMYLSIQMCFYMGERYSVCNSPFLPSQLLSIYRQKRLTFLEHCLVHPVIHLCLNVIVYAM